MNSMKTMTAKFKITGCMAGAYAENAGMCLCLLKHLESKKEDRMKIISFRIVAIAKTYFFLEQVFICTNLNKCNRN